MVSRKLKSFSCTSVVLNAWLGVCQCVSVDSDLKRSRAVWKKSLAEKWDRNFFSKIGQNFYRIQRCWPWLHWLRWRNSRKFFLSKLRQCWLLNTSLRTLVAKKIIRRKAAKRNMVFAPYPARWCSRECKQCLFEPCLLLLSYCQC